MRKWKLIKKEVLHKDYWNSVNRNTYELPNGKIVKDYIVLDCRHVAMVMAVTKDRKVVLIREYKTGANRIAFQLPAGYIGDGESPEVSAKRELVEETGYTARKFEKLGSLYSSNGKINQLIYCFLAENAEKVRNQKLDEYEDIEVKLVDLRKIVKMVENGIIESTDSAAFILMGVNRLRK